MMCGFVFPDSEGEVSDNDRQRMPCWTLLICAIPASVLLSTLCILGLCFCSGLCEGNNYATTLYNT